jgi:hypothetical protein
MVIEPMSQAFKQQALTLAPRTAAGAAGQRPMDCDGDRNWMAKVLSE